MSRPLLGLDLGHDTVRAVALRRVGTRFQVTGTASVRRRDDTGQPRSLAVTLGELESVMRLRGQPGVAIGDLTTLVRYVALPPLPPDRLQRLLHLELSQSLDGGGELAADTFLVPQAGDELIHGCVLAQTPQVYAALAELRAVGIHPDHIHFASAAIFNATLPQAPVQGEELALLVDIGATTTGLTLFGEQRLLACRQVSLGGDHFTAALATAGDLPATKAEVLKITGAPYPKPARPYAAHEPVHPFADAPPRPGPLALDAAPEPDPAAGSSPGISIGALFADDPAAAPPPAAAPKDDFVAMLEQGVSDLSPPDGVPTALGPELAKAAESLYVQISSSLSWFKAQVHLRNLAISRIYLSGGGAGLTGLDAYLSRRFNLPVAIFDPFAGLDGDRPERPHEYATALGLALSTAPDPLPGTIVLDLTPERVLRRRAWYGRLAWTYVAAASLAVATVLLAWTLITQQAANRASLDTYAAFKSNYDRLMAQKQTLEQEQQDQAEDLRAIASRIYAGRDLLYTVRALKEQTQPSKELWVTRLETVDISQDTAVRDPATATGRLRSGPDREGRRDTAIDRGAVDISGSVKFDLAHTDTELNQFFERWVKAVENWSPEPLRSGSASIKEPRLFRDSRVLEHIIQHQTDTNKKHELEIKDGRFPFKVRFFFQPTQLEQITAERPAAGQER
jgi:Tfp pilus assembly PilM family ATPase